jgi:amino acid transporter/nucleotide-binding universal stress UspA family protein
MSDLSSSVPSKTRVVVATTVLLSFISFWRAAAIVLNDLGSSAFYVAGIAEEAFGKSAPWFILGVMLFANLVRMVYIESCAMFVRGGVYRVVKEAMGPRLGKLAVSALMFDYILTGPISSVSAGQYLGGLLNDLGSSQYLNRLGWQFQLPRDPFTVLFAVAVTVYFWRKNVRGLHESSERALQIMWVVTAMVVTLLAWSAITLFQRPALLALPPLPSLETLHFHSGSLGWLEGTAIPQIAVFAFLIAFGHSVLAMSGEESLAQVNREIEHPKLKNLKRAGVVIGLYTLVFTAGVSFLAVMIIPDAARPQYFTNMISGLAMSFSGPLEARLAMQAFVVVVGVLMLSGAVNTAIIGSNGVLNRVAEDGILTDWFRKPHSRFGTTSRLINLVVVLQLVTIVASGGRVTLLGEAYAFGVIWSFTMMTTSILVLRFKRAEHREWKVPGNFRFRGREIPAGVGLVAFLLLSIALANLLTKKHATVAGLAFTAAMFTVFTVSERITVRRRAARAGVDQFQLHHEESIHEGMDIRPGCILVPVRDFHTLEHLRAVLQRTDTDVQDVVVMTTRLVHGADFAGEFVAEEHLFSEYEQTLFSRVVSLAEKMGKPVSLVVLPATDPFDAILLSAQRLRADQVVMGQSSKLSTQEQARLTGLAWERLPQPRPRLDLEIFQPSGQGHTFHLGPHAPSMKPDDVETLHRLWLELSSRPDLRQLHHHQIVTVALRRLAASLRRGAEGEGILQELKRLVKGEN